MIAKILIKRTFQKDVERQILPILQKMRAAAMSQPGYISGETLTNYENPQRVTVIGTWQSMENWLSWKSSPERFRCRTFRSSALNQACRLLSLSWKDLLMITLNPAGTCLE